MADAASVAYGAASAPKLALSVHADHAKQVHVRIESETTSVGRSYSETAKGANVERGLGARRRALRTRTFDPFHDGAAPVVDSLTEAWTDLRCATRAQVLRYFQNTWDLTTTLFSALRDDSVFYMIPDKLRRPLIFYFCHPAALYVNKMHEAGLLEHVHPYYQKVFETGVDEMSWDDMDVMQDEDFAWPDMASAVAFRDAVHSAVVEAIGRMPEPTPDAPIDASSPWWALFMGFEHENIHFETSSVLMRQLPAACVAPPRGWRTAPTFTPTPAAAPRNAVVSVPASVAVIGKPSDFPSFGWDNEYGHRVVPVPAFEVAEFKVTNAEFLPFVEAGGYTDRRWWVSPSGDDEGWRWRTFRNATHPSFWVADAHPSMARYVGGTPGWPYQRDDGNAAVAGADGSWKLRAAFAVLPSMPWDWPVEVCYHEAAAFLRWKAATEGGGVRYRMPTEAEYHAFRADPSPHAAAVLPATAVAAGGAAPGVFAGAFAGAARHAALPPGAPDGGVMLPPGCPSEAAARASAAKAAAAADTPPAPGAGVDDGAALRVDPIMGPTASGNVNLRWHSSTPVDLYGPSAAGARDAHGNVWEYTEDHFAPLPGFEAHALYDDFSSPCFDGWHTLIVGGSWASRGNLASGFARYHFRRHFFQHLGFRYVRLPHTAPPEPFPGAATVANLWERQSTIAADLANGYPIAPPPAAVVAVTAAAAAAAAPPPPPPPAGLDAPADYAARLAQTVADAFDAAARDASAGAAATGGSGCGAAARARASVLHVGCGAGAGTFQLAHAGFGAVVGLDARESCVRAARLMQHHGQLAYDAVREGVLTAPAVAVLPPGVTPEARARVYFAVGDVGCDDVGSASPAPGAAAADRAPLLPPDVAELAPFDVVVVDGALCALTQPLGLVRALPGLIKPGGLAVVASSNSWDPAVTPRNSWLGGYSMNGAAQPTLTVLGYHLKRGFELAAVTDVPRVTRAHGRRFTVDLMETSVWRRRGAPTASPQSTACDESR